MGCTDCGNKGGCDARKHAQRERFDEALGRVYPDRTWGRLDDEARFGAGVARSEARRLARAIAAGLEAPTFFRPGGDDDLCDFVYVLCVGRAPALLEVRDGLAAPEAGPIEERYLRLALSSVARLGAVQEVAMSLDRAEVIEAPRSGVFDPTLLRRMQKLVALLEDSDVTHVDFGMIDRPLEGSAPGAYVERFGVEPRLVNFLFFAQPAMTRTITPVGR